MRILFLLFGSAVIAPFMIAMVTAVQSFQRDYNETLCRMESVRVHAIEDIQNDRPMVANFGGDECLTPVIPTVALSFEDLAGETPTPASFDAPAP
jgi:hypothetical protein